MIFGASVCLVDQNDRVLMITREKEPFRDAFAFPGGRIEDGEGALDAARRELTEETGYVAIGDPFAHVVIVNSVDEKTFRIESFAFAKWVAPKNPTALSCEWMTFEQALASRLAPGMHEALETFRKVVR